MKKIHEKIIQNNPLIKNYINQNNLSEKETEEELNYLISCRGYALHLESKIEGDLVNIKEVQNSLLIKSGLYKFSDEGSTSDMSFEQVSLKPTEEGYEFFRTQILKNKNSMKIYGRTEKS